MREIAVLSGKGGTGKTCLSAAFAALCNHIVLADCDVDAANLYLLIQPENDYEERFATGQKAVIDNDLCVNCGICANYCRFGAISCEPDKTSISNYSCDGCMLCMRVCPQKAITMSVKDKSRWYSGSFERGKMVYARLEPGEENSGKLVSVVRKKAREIAREIDSNTILIDGPPGTGCPAISSVTGAKRAIMVTEPTGSGFHDMKRILELTQSFGVKSYVVINKFDLNNDVTSHITAWCYNNNIAIAGKISFDQEVVDAMLNGKSIIEWRPKSNISKEIITIWSIINEDER